MWLQGGRWLDALITLFMLVLGRSTRQSAKPCTSVCGIICDLVAGGVLLTRKILEFVFTALTVYTCVVLVWGTRDIHGWRTYDPGKQLSTSTIAISHLRASTELHSTSASNEHTDVCVRVRLYAVSRRRYVIFGGAYDYLFTVAYERLMHIIVVCCLVTQ